jgi:predicted dienelactone hydrolase
MAQKDTSEVAEIRRTVRGYLAERPSVAQSPDTITARLRREHGFTEDEVKDACVVLTALRHLSESTDPLGGSLRYYRATAEGILAHEAGF